jgi:hypothetical protein
MEKTVFRPITLKKLLKNPRNAFFRGFRQKTADAKGAKARWFQSLYAGAEAPAS